MEFLNHVPLAGIILGIFLLFLLVGSNGGIIKNFRTKTCLLLIILLNIHLQFDCYLYYNNNYYQWFWGYSFLFYHSFGALFYLYTIFLLNEKFKLKWWGILFLLYTCVHFTTTIYDATKGEQSVRVLEVLSFLDNYISILLNIIFIAAAYFRIKSFHFSVQLSKSEKNNYEWIKGLLLVSLLLFCFSFIINVGILFQAKDWVIFMKFESFILSLFFFGLAYYSIRFPLFSIHGDYKEIKHTSKEKYAKSSLKRNEYDQLWDDLLLRIETKKEFLNPEYRLNDLAKSLNKSLHHVSQIINEKEGSSFSEFINSYRIEEAKKFLQDSHYKSYTILAIAYEVGFNSKTSFYNAFKKQTGITPTQYRKQSLSH